MFQPCPKNRLPGGFFYSFFIHQASMREAKKGKTPSTALSIECDSLPGADPIGQKRVPRLRARWTLKIR
jgi:hypothetical protein